MTVNIKSTEVRLSFSFVFVLTLMMALCQESIVLMCVCASVMHELGHLLFMKLFAERIISIDFGAFGVRIERRSIANLSYKKECIIALGGIIVNLVLAFPAIMYYYFMKSQTALMFSLINLFIALFNCIPLNILDMGRALRCLLMLKYDEARTDKKLRVLSLICVNALAAVCVLYSAFICVNPSLIAVTLYLYVITLFEKWS